MRDDAGVEDEIVEARRALNAAAARLVELIRRALEGGVGEGSGRSAERWAAWRCGASPERARRLVVTARRLAEGPEDRGPTDTADLVALCHRHHRMRHLGRLGVSGDADDPDGLVFVDERGRRLTGSGGPAPPAAASGRRNAAA